MISTLNKQVLNQTIDYLIAFGCDSGDIIDCVVESLNRRGAKPALKITQHKNGDQTISYLFKA